MSGIRAKEGREAELEELRALEESITRDYCDGSMRVGDQIIVDGNGHCTHAMLVRKYNPETGLMDFISGRAYPEEGHDETFIEYVNRVGDDFLVVCPCCRRASTSKISLEDAVRMWNEGEAKPLCKPEDEE